jgi:trimeric autotransporter adhesin
MFITRFLIVLSSALILTACGGGSSGGGTSSSKSSFSYSFSSLAYSSNGTGNWPSVKVDAFNSRGDTPKILTFSWSPVEGAIYYKLMKNQGGNSGFVQVGGNIMATSTTELLSAKDENISVHLQDWINTRYVVEACIADGNCQTSSNTYTATEMIKAIGLIHASNSEENDQFGWSVTLSGDGNTLAVGAPSEDSNATGANGNQESNTSLNSGAVYVFVKNNGLWEQQAYLKASNTEQPSLNSYRFLPNDRFGYQVALSDDGNTLAVSAIFEDSPSWGVNCNQQNYEVTGIVNSSYSSSSSSFSTDSSISSSINTDQIIIAAQSYNIGAVYTFKRTDNVWTQEAYLKPNSSLVHLSADLKFGESLALSGDGKTLAVGTTSDLLGFIETNNVVHFNNSSIPECLNYSSLAASLSSSSTSSTSSSSSSQSSSSVKTWGGTQSGAVYTFIHTEEGWKTEAWIKAANSNAGDAFGTNLALSQDGNTLAVGAIGEDSPATGINGNGDSNGCYYFQDQVITPDDACAKSPTYLLNNGAAYVFTRNAGIWGQEAYLKPGSQYPNALFGVAVDLSNDGSTLAVGATGDANNISGAINQTPQYNNDAHFANSGAAYIFTRSGTSWSQQAFIKPQVVLPGYQFGNDVKLSGDGNILAVNSLLESSNSVGIDGNPGDVSATGAGAMYIFKRSSTQWSQSAYVKASDTKAQDRFGAHATLSDDGKTLAAGAHRKAGAASSNSSSSVSAEAAGGVYIY